MKLWYPILTSARLVLAALAGSVVLTACETTQPDRPTDQPWNNRESWEGTARFGNFPQSR